ncbi:bifunctional 5,10-methylenetetrahydrofolate dehydrogenase/5,10-methenyltetrahydrofolate cyclohydrolase [Streptomyces europaeiscabiei]|uniref:tetrahydrofolate dehydrogenase/cyclohydrolase catalytic domain-containing protein n=1 Tax=Streptomyces europaeiscabiei TaxID=146819 RepID=UPI0029A40FF5|nr:tetrahydrofolate dehydrogenase/cyclohydrolase catalytic domain-containing protein [Streptomyces europaeiscabiei]MDX3588075.1 tetrahydrofolate dehydrogenase/cyclohydrolase catalytic domain-containing protein [Streptomyces europaeiscabiei]MDX3633611.1 tetrahydrofolate dehydrogenase/cyclohydrolase catalytic domain-containing protein [Streptomyces europaeiscabiei]MDX3651090.1 tetrahydrofolate dehydrogenase/cyclohydrolase catalytic domain-containing protein [Streptomyces europaeiscabiei]
MTEHVSGRDVLRRAKELYAPYRDAVAPTGQRVAIIRFRPAENDPAEWKVKLEASKVSAEQKVKSFEHLGFRADHVVMPPGTTRAQFAEALERANRDPATRAIIVQFPPPAHLQPLVQRMDPAKDIDALTKGRSPYTACATAEGICRVVEPFAQDDPLIAVVGGKGFVGQGVVTTLREQGHRLMELDAGDDLRRVRDADIVVSVTGNPGILGPDHLRPHHRLVVDSGFVPQADGTVKGDVQRAAYDIPQHLTPVPGGIGPVEMATLMERVVRREVDPDAPSWKVEPRPYLTREQLTQPSPETTRAPMAAARTAAPTSTADERQGPGRGQGAEPGRGQGSEPGRGPTSLRGAAGQRSTTGPGGAGQQPTTGRTAAGQHTPASGNPVADAARRRTGGGGSGAGGVGPTAAGPTAGPSAPARAQIPYPPKPPTPGGPGR